MQGLIPLRQSKLLLAALVCAVVAGSTAAAAPSQQPTWPPLPQATEDQPTTGGIGVPVQPPQTGPAATAPAETSRPVPADVVVAPPEITEEVRPSPRRLDFWPPLSGAGVTWFAVVVILVLTFRIRPLVSVRNVDALVLAATGLLLALRLDDSSAPGGAVGQSGQWWSYLLLSVAAGYWLLRGLRYLLARNVNRYEGSISSDALLILVLAGLGLGIARIATDPLSPGSRDALVGGLHMVDTGRLPYGEVPGHDARSPLLYLLHAGAAKVVAPATAPQPDDPKITMTWGNRAQWMQGQWWQEGDFVSARLVNALLFVAFVLALYVIGRRLHSAAIGLTMVGLFCVFPGTLECISRPEAMLPAVLLAWSVALALVPGVGGLLSASLIVIAGLAWPWAWLALPVLLGYFVRHGVHAAGGVVGALGGVVLSLAGITWLTLPSPPRADGALHRAVMQPTHTLSTDERGNFTVAPREAGVEPAKGLLRSFWKFVVNSENLSLSSGARIPDLSRFHSPDDSDISQVLYRRLEPLDDTAREELAFRYRRALADEPTVTRLWCAVRTVLEQTWLARQPTPTVAPGSWTLWSASGTLSVEAWSLIRRLVKVVVGLLAILVGVVLMIGQRPRPHQLVGGLLLVSSAALLASSAGAVNNLVWLLPVVLALWAANEQPSVKGAEEAKPATPESMGSAGLFRSGPAPRISVDD